MTIFGLKKIFNYFSIFTIILGSAFGTFNSAHAGDGDDVVWASLSRFPKL